MEANLGRPGPWLSLEASKDWGSWAFIKGDASLASATLRDVCDRFCRERVMEIFARQHRGGQAALSRATQLEGKPQGTLWCAPSQHHAMFLFTPRDVLV